MTLLAPGNLLLAAMVALPLLLLLYMLKLRRRPVRVSTVAFWTRAPEDSQANTPFQAPRPSWLLLLHFLIVASMLIAIGRPALRDNYRSAQRTFIIIDTSASMSALDGNDERTRLERAKVIAKEQASRVLGGGGLGGIFSGLGSIVASGGNRQVAVITSAAEAQLASPFTSSSSLVEAAIDRVEATDQPGNLSAAFELARTAISSDTEENGQRDGSIILVTDGVADISRLQMPGSDVSSAEAGATSGDSVSSASMQLRTPAHRLRSPLALQVITVGDGTEGKQSGLTTGGEVVTPNAPINRGVTLLAAQRPTRSSPGTVQVFVQVASNAVLGAGSPSAGEPLPGDDVPISVSLNGAVIARRVVTVPGRQTATDNGVEAGVGSIGQAGAVGAPVITPEPGGEPTPSASIPTGLTTATIELTNVGSGVLVVTIDLVDSLASDNFAAMVLESAVKPAVLLVQPQGATSAAHVLLADVLSELETRGVTVVNNAEYAALANAGGLGVHDIVMFDGVVPESLAPIPSLTFGGVAPGGLCTREERAAGGGNVRFFWNRSHPLLRNITLDSLIIDDTGYFACGSEPARGYEAIISTREGALLTAFTLNSNRHIAASFALERTNWPLQPSFAVFLADALGYFTQQSDESAGRMSTTTQPVSFRRHEGATSLAGPVLVTLPPRDSSAGTTESGNSAGVTETLVGTLPRAGVYVVTPPPPVTSTASSGASTLRADRAVAVNLLNSTESLLTSVIAPGRSDGRGTAIAPSESKDGDVLAEFWPLAVLAAMLLLCVEWFVYGRGGESGRGGV